MSEKDLSSTSRTNWVALEAADDDNIDYSDIPALTDEFFENATLRVPASQAEQLVQIDPDILKWFQSQSEEYRTSINSALRYYIENIGEQSTV